jgi:2-oxo-3-hexenedioate decarboxylase
MNISKLAGELLDALDRGATIPSIVGRDPRFGWDEGYRVAAEILKLRRARGDRNIWAEYNATAPIWAHVYDRTIVHASGGQCALSLRNSARPRLEPEIAFRLKTSVKAGAMDTERVLEAIEWMAPSFEIVDCHFDDWKFGPADSAADFALHWRLIVGAPVPLRQADLAALAPQIRDCRVTLSRKGEVVDQGTGANALGHPALALAHLAQVLSSQPLFEPLAAGEVITTGTLTAAMPIRPGETWESRYHGLPGVTGLSLTLEP